MLNLVSPYEKPLMKPNERAVTPEQVVMHAIQKAKIMGHADIEIVIADGKIVNMRLTEKTRF